MSNIVFIRAAVSEVRQNFCSDAHKGNAFNSAPSMASIGAMLQIPSVACIAIAITSYTLCELWQEGGG